MLQFQLQEVPSRLIKIIYISYLTNEFAALIVTIYLVFPNLLIKQETGICKSLRQSKILYYILLKTTYTLFKKKTIQFKTIICTLEEQQCS